MTVTYKKDEHIARATAVLESALKDHPDVGACASAGRLRRWVYAGIPPGGFLSALLRNNLTKAVNKADDENLRLMASWARVMDRIPEDLKNVGELVE
jgi:hypothetical protein